MNRADRRRQIKDDVKIAISGIDVAARRADHVCSLMRAFHSHVVEGQRSGSLTKLYSLAFGSLAKSDRSGPKDLIQCSKGCSHCCHMWVSVSAPEALILAGRLKSAGRDTAPLLAKAELTRGMDFEGRGHFVAPCPLLGEDAACSVYDARPIACRTATSTDADLCRRAYLALSEEDIPTPMFYLMERAAYAIALKGAFKRAGLPTAAYELNSAITVALQTPNAERRWLSGEDIFRDVPQDPHGDPFDQPHNLHLYLEAFR